jgi:hypothetical protein
VIGIIEAQRSALERLAYFGDADAAPLPLGLSSPLWTAIKEAFAKRVRAL